MESESYWMQKRAGNKSYSFSRDKFITDPKFIDDNSLLTAVQLRWKDSISEAEISTGNTMRLTTPSYNVIVYPCVNNGMYILWPALMAMMMCLHYDW
jgi:hypothetical protein